MLAVKDVNGQMEGLTDVSNFEHVEELNTELSLSFSAYRTDQNVGYELLQEESVINHENREYRIKNLQAYKDYKTVDAISIYYDNSDVWQYDTFGGSHTFNEFMDFVLTGTGWSYVNVDVMGNKLIPNFGNANVLTLIEVLLSTFECDMKIGEGKTLLFANDIGLDDDFQYRYGKNIVALSQTINTTNLKTFIKGFGAEGLEVSYTSPNASSPGIGIRHAEPIYDDRFTIADSLAEYLATQIVDVPEVAIELEAVELENKNVGDYVWLIYEPLGIEFQTQVLKKVSRIPVELSTITIGNATRKTLSDSLVSQNIEVSENKRQTRSRIDQTNDRITLEVEAVNESIATLTIQADEIELNVSAIDGRLGSAEASISVQAGQISQKVSQTDYNGDVVWSMITQTPHTIKLQADNIDLLGITNVASELYIGTSFADSTLKAIRFRGTAGGVSISSANADSLNINSNYLSLNASILDIPSYASVRFNNASVSGLNMPYHDHGSLYTYSEIGQNIQIYMNRSNNTMEFLNGTRRLSVSTTVLSS